MTGSSIICMHIDDIHEMLSRLTIDPRSSPYYVQNKDYAQTLVKLLKTFFCYTAKWSDADKYKHFAYLSTDMEVSLSSLHEYISYYFACQNTTKTETVANKCYWFLKTFLRSIAETYDKFLKVSHPPICDHLVFDEFVTSVEEYLVSLPLALDSFFNCMSPIPEQWLPPSSTETIGYYNTTAQKLGSFKCFISNFAKRCLKEEKLKFILGHAGAMVLSIAHSACQIHLYLYRSNIFSLHLFRASANLSQKVSPHNPDVAEIYSGVLEAYVEVVQTAKQPGGEALDPQSLDLMVRPDDYTQDVELFLTNGVAALAREAGYLNYSIYVDQMPNVVMREASRVISKLLHKIKLIKAEVFLLELHKQRARLMVPTEDRVATIREELRSLNFFKTPEGYMEDSEKMILALIEAVVGEAGSLYNTYQAEKITENVILDSSLAIFMLFKAEAMLRILINKNASLMFLAKYQIGTLYKDLIFLRALLSNPTNNMEDEKYFSFVEAMVSEATSLVCSFGDNKMEKDQPLEMDLLLSHLPRAIELHLSEIQAIYQKGTWSLLSDFPKSDGVVFIDFLLVEVRELLANKSDIIAYMKDQVKDFVLDLEVLGSFLKDVAGKHHENKDLQTRVLCLMYEAEYIIDLFVAEDVSLWYHQLLLFNAIGETKLLKKQVKIFLPEVKRCESPVQGIELTSSGARVVASNPRIEEVIVGLDDQANTVMGQLRGGSRHLQIISIVGTAGLGKTTLAKKIYNNSSIENHFFVRAWCYVSQVYRKRELMLDILSDFIELTDQIKRMDDEDLALTLCQGLRRNRYLIVLDDIWSTEQLNDLMSLFPDDKNGSRILLTGRTTGVASEGNPEPHFLPFLSETESWELLQKKIFHPGKCPDHLLEVGQQIAKNCKGLPLAIVVVGGLLKRTNNKKDWKQVAEHLRSRIADDQQRRFMDILKLSYKHLPAYLRPCFLYFGAFLEDQEIPVQKLK